MGNQEPGSLRPCCPWPWLGGALGLQTLQSGPGGRLAAVVGGALRSPSPVLRRWPKRCANGGGAGRALSGAGTGGAGRPRSPAGASTGRRSAARALCSCCSGSILSPSASLRPLSFSSPSSPRFSRRPASPAPPTEEL